MARRIPGSERTREALSDLIEGRLLSGDAKSALVRLATRLIIEEGREAEVRDALGRDDYEHGCEAGPGHRNGYRPGRLKTAEGFIEYSAPQVAGTEEPFRSELRRPLKGAGGPGYREAGPRAFRSRHRGRLQGRERAVVAVEDGGQRDRPAAVGGLPGIRDA